MRKHSETWAGCTVSLTTPTRPLPTNLMLMVLVWWGGGEVYSSTSTSSPGHGNFGGSGKLSHRASSPSRPWVRGGQNLVGVYENTHIHDVMLGALLGSS